MELVLVLLPLLRLIEIDWSSSDDFDEVFLTILPRILYSANWMRRLRR